MTLPTDRRPHILVSNDDGIEALGLQVLCAALEPLADLTIVAPAAERSGMGHAISFLKDMAVIPHERGGRVWGWALDGTPADCVKAGVLHISRRPIDLVLSGINRGQNAGINVHYSGTIGAAREAALLGLPAIAVSLYYHAVDNMPYDTAARVAVEISTRVLQQGLPPGVLLNVNVPPLTYDELQGWVVTRMGTASYKDRLLYQPAAEGKPAFFRNVGDSWRLSADGENANDDRAIEAGKVAITPLECDQTAHAFIPSIQSLINGQTAVKSPPKYRRNPSHIPDK